MESLKKKFFENYENLKRMAKKQFPKNLEDEEAAFNYLIEKISENNWQRLSECTENKFDGCLKEIAKNLLIDCSRKILGRYRTPKWIKDRGALWIEIHRFLCFNRLTRDEIREEIEIIMSIIVDCGDKYHIPPDDFYEQEDYQQNSLIQKIGRIIFGEEYELDSDLPFEKIKEVINEFRSKLQLTPEDRVFLKLIFQDDVKIYIAGDRVYGITQRKSYAKYENLINYILEIMEQTRLKTELKNLFEP